MDEDHIQYLSKDKLEALKAELKGLKEEKIPELAKRIDDARQMGDLSENAEYHSAREDMAWAQSRSKEIQNILDNAKVISDDHSLSGIISIGSIILVKVNDVTKEYVIVGQQEADPTSGRISNESPLGSSFLGKKKGDKVEVNVPAGVQLYNILEVK